MCEMGEGVLGEEKILIVESLIIEHHIFMSPRSVFYFVIYFFVLVLLAYVCFGLKFKHSEISDKEIICFKYYVPKDADPYNPHDYRFEVPTILNSISKKKFMSVNLTTDPIENQKRLDFIQFEARKLKYTNDTTQIIKVFIPDSSKYGTFLSLLYIMNEDQHKRYFEYKNWFYIFGEAPEKKDSVKEITPIYM